MNNNKLKNEIAEYWNQRIHDLEIAKSPVGSREFFEELSEYRFDKLRYLPKIVDFAGFKGKKILEIGCGAGIDLVEFGAGGAIVTGIDLSKTAIDLAKKYFSYLNIRGLKKKKEIFNSFSWYLLTIAILFSLSQLGAFFFTKIILIILNSSYGLPFIYRNSIFALILPTILIFILTILEAIYYLSFRLKGVNHFVSKIEKRKL